MCGIAGYLGPRSDALSRIGNAMARSLAHRGPDDEGLEAVDIDGCPDRAILLAHRRLSILDLSPLGHQPMHDAETGNWIVYNGETYNFKSLRRDLEHQGCSFRSQSDTEVLLKGYARRGINILDDLCGMFAFGLWDRQRRELVLAVDHVGIKPLYYWAGSNGAFLFASELRALMATGLVPRRVDPVGLEGYLSYGAVQGPHTIIAGVRILPPGSYLRIRADGQIDGPHEYWRAQFPTADREPVQRVEDVVAEVRALLDQVVAEHLVSDVPLGVFLSGGIDSSSVLASASSGSRSLKTFSIGFAEQEFSEAAYSREMATRYGSQHTEICLSEGDLLKMLPGALDALDQPTLDGTNVYVISRAVRDAGVTVVLSGQGGDEIFGGYPTFQQVEQAAMWRRRLAVVPRLAWAGGARLWDAVQARRRVIPDKVGQWLGGDGSAFTAYFLLRQVFPPSVRRSLFPGEHRVSPEGLPADLAQLLRDRVDNLDVFNLVSLLECRTYLGNMLLRDGDVMSMAHSLEVRVPFLDRRLVEMVSRLPGQTKLDGPLPKALLLKAMGDRLPASIYQRPKQGFTFPWSHWLRQDLRPMADEALNDRTAFLKLGMDPSAVLGLWRAFLAGRPGITWSRIWTLIVLREWTNRHGAALA